MIQNVTYHCPKCKVAITTAALKRTVVKKPLKKDERFHEEAYYTGKCYNCNEPLTIDKNGINHQWERPEI